MVVIRTLRARHSLATDVALATLVPGQTWTALRHISEEQLNADKDRLEDLFHKNLAQADRTRRAAFLTTRREALALYREILRYSNLLVWKDAKGNMWRDVIRASARKEFEDARIETDPEIINKLIITGRDAVQRVVERFVKKRADIIEEEAQAQDAAAGNRPPEVPH